MSKKSKLKSLFDYINSCADKKEVYYFDNPNDAYDFGKKLRDIETREENVSNEYQIEKLIIDISGNAVRIYIPAEESACVGSGCK